MYSGYKTQHAERTQARVRDLMLGAKNFHTIEEIKSQLEKVHGVRFNKEHVLSAIGKLRAAGYPLAVRYRGPAFAGARKVPEYQLGERIATQESRVEDNHA